VQNNDRLQVLFLRSSSVTDRDLLDMSSCLTYDPSKPLSHNKTLKVLDVSANPLTAPLPCLTALLSGNRTLEYLGLARCKLSSSALLPLLQLVGRVPFPSEEAEAHLAKCKARDVLVEKNKKAKAGKKPEEPVPLLDNIEQLPDQEDQWVLLRNVQFKHLNLCMNEDLDDDLETELALLLSRTNDEFGVTLSGCGLTQEVVNKLRDGLVQAKAALPPGPEGEDRKDQWIGHKRIAF